MLNNGSKNSLPPNQFIFGTQLITIIIVALLIIIASFYTGKLVSKGAAGLSNTESFKQYKLLEIELNNTKSRLSMAETTNKINTKALEQTRQTILQLEQQLYQQQKDIISYKAILSKQKPIHPLVFRDLIIQATEKALTYRYKLVLTRADQANTLLKGSLKLIIKGTVNGKPQSLSLTDIIATENQQNISFSFRYMTMIPEKSQFAEFTLPENFIPKAVEVTVFFMGDIKPITHSFKWLAQPLPIQDIEDEAS